MLKVSSQQGLTPTHSATLSHHLRQLYLHVSGTERAGEEAGGAAALVSTPAEEALRAAVYEGAAFSSHNGGPAEVLMGLLQQPFLELKVAAYRQVFRCCCCTQLTVNLGSHPLHHQVAICRQESICHVCMVS